MLEQNVNVKSRELEQLMVLPMGFVTPENGPDQIRLCRPRERTADK